MKSHIENIQTGARLLYENERVQTVITGVQKTITTFWLFFGMIPGWALLSALYVFIGVWNVYVLGDATGNITSALDILTADRGWQLGISLVQIAYGYLLSSTRDKYLLTVGVLFVLAYAVLVGIGTATGQIDIRGLLAFGLYVITALSISVASYSAWQKAEAEEQAEAEKDKLADMEARYESLRIVLDQTRQENKRLTEIAKQGRSESNVGMANAEAVR